MIPNELLPDFRRSLISGEYSLLLGSSISLDSVSNGTLLPTASALTGQLNTLKGAPANTALATVYGLLSKTEIDQYITRRFSRCIPGASLQTLPRYLWERVYTFNVDDVLENLYAANAEAKQELSVVNFVDDFMPTPTLSNLQCVHLHGTVLRANDGYVFSHTEYARYVRNGSPWMMALANTIATSPFIIAGCSLVAEPDLEYYLAGRTSESPQRGRGPGLLIDPNANVVTENLCKRHNLTLVRARFGDFLEWLKQELPTPPRVEQLIVPDVTTLFADPPEPKLQVEFFSTFEVVKGTKTSTQAAPSPFFFGKAPSWDDIWSHADIERRANSDIYQAVVLGLNDKKGNVNRIVDIQDLAGSGKTTALRRVASDLAASGYPVFSLYRAEGLPIETIRAVLASLRAPAVLVIDNLADYIDQLVKILNSQELLNKTVILGTDRQYRASHVETLTGHLFSERLPVGQMNHREHQQLIERYRKLGLVGDGRALGNTDRFIGLLAKDTVAVATCRILHDFKPLTEIARSLWNDCPEPQQSVYLACAVAARSLEAGVRFSILQAVAGPRASINPLLSRNAVLPLSKSESDNNLLVPTSRAIADAIIDLVSRSDPDALFDVMRELSAALAPLVNRTTIVKKTAEARLAPRLFRQEFVSELLGSRADEFYDVIARHWDWNSRYWEQRALREIDRNSELAVQFARQAYAIEQHAFPITTLGRVLIARMRDVRSNPHTFFDEALTLLDRAITFERRNDRIAIHPYMVLLSGTISYHELRGTLSKSQAVLIEGHCSDMLKRYGNDNAAQLLVQRTRKVLDGYR